MLHVVLYEPEIPQNTGNIIRTCMATGSRLHLIEPLGFSLDEKHLRRSGMDYIKDADIHIHKDWDAFVAENPSEHYYFMTRYGKKAPSEFDFTKEEGDVYLVLGKESTGVDKKILQHRLKLFDFMSIARCYPNCFFHFITDIYYRKKKWGFQQELC